MFSGEAEKPDQVRICVAYDVSLARSPRVEIERKGGRPSTRLHDNIKGLPIDGRINVADLKAIVPRVRK